MPMGHCPEVTLTREKGGQAFVARLRFLLLLAGKPHGHTRKRSPRRQLPHLYKSRRNIFPRGELYNGRERAHRNFVSGRLS
jgi:hypothetical protein